jgi:hypothetical protein
VQVTLTTAEPDALVARVASRRWTRELWYRSPTATWTTPPPTLDFLAVALAPLASAEGEDLHVDGPVSADQLTSLEEYLQIWSVWRPDLYRPIRIGAAEEVLETPKAEGGAALGFSGGVDASFALAAHHDGLLGRLTRRIELGVLVVGWDLRHGDESGLARAVESARASLDAYGVDLGVIATNWQQELCSDWFLSFTAGLAAVLHTTSGRCSSAVVATDHNALGELGMRPYGSHLMTNRLLGTGHFPLQSTGPTHSRLERVRALTQHPVLLAQLRVCYQEGAGGSNCGRCEKCVRTQLELRACGIAADHLFSEQMRPSDLDELTVNRPTVLVYFEEALHALAPEDPLRGRLRRAIDRERLRFAREEGSPLAALAQAQADLTQVSVELDALRASKSWQVTAPLRALRAKAIGS